MQRIFNINDRRFEIEIVNGICNVYILTRLKTRVNLLCSFAKSKTEIWNHLRIIDELSK